VTFREQLAHHEAAHAVLALHFGAGLASQGIDLDAPTSVQGAYGTASVNLFVPDLTEPQAEQLKVCGSSLAIVCAGAASDARVLGIPLADALAAQPGDESTARQHVALYPFGQTRGDQDNALTAGLEIAERTLQAPGVWDAVEAVAREVLIVGGKLPPDKIRDIATPILAAARAASNPAGGNGSQP
jgi:hypothetical protein